MTPHRGRRQRVEGRGQRAGSQGGAVWEGWGARRSSGEALRTQSRDALSGRTAWGASERAGVGELVRQSEHE